MPPAAPTPISRDQIERLVEAWRASQTELWQLLEAVGANTIAEMTSAQAIRAMSWLQQRRRHSAEEQASAEGDGG